MDINEAIRNEILREEQRKLEKKYSEKTLRDAIAQDILLIDANMAKVQHGVSLLDEWLTGEHSDEKQERLNQIRDFNLEDLTLTAFSVTAECRRPELFVGIAAAFAHRLGFDDHAAAVKTAAEILTVLCYSGGFSMNKETKYSPWMIENMLILSRETDQLADRVMFIPPMICQPETVKHAYASPYLTFDEPVMTGKAELTHQGEIGLDVINTQNSIALSIDMNFVRLCAELPPEGIEDEDGELDHTGHIDRTVDWSTFRQQSASLYEELVDAGNKFYMTWKPDQRLRLYAKGYHINPQGRPFKKAMLNFHKKEVVTGF